MSTRTEALRALRRAAQAAVAAGVDPDDAVLEVAAATGARAEAIPESAIEAIAIRVTDMQTAALRRRHAERQAARQQVRVD